MAAEIKEISEVFQEQFILWLLNGPTMVMHS